MSTAQKKHDPVIVLSRPQMGENIGAAARVMRNFGLTELRLIEPRDGWPNNKSTAMAAGAFAAMEPVRVFKDAATALGDLQLVFAVTARLRDMEKPVLSLGQAIQQLHVAGAENCKIGLLFGAEASGLSNAEIARCDGIITYPVAADFRSLNLAQAVAIAAYAWREGDEKDALEERLQAGEARSLASGQDIDGMLEHLRVELVDAGFFYPPEKQAVMMQNLQNMFVRARLSTQEARTFRGVIKSLSKGRGKMYR
ncbi:MAG: rRNA methyltransferase [Robiginitomaculum sp.]|nr:MAG: rRNA methyltransferase [Robiginitomaculum sp.]